MPQADGSSPTHHAHDRDQAQDPGRSPDPDRPASPTPPGDRASGMPKRQVGAGGALLTGSVLGDASDRSCRCASLEHAVLS
jgi:hypothetical protein